MQNLLALLSDSQFHSGEELGKELGVTRAAVWKKLKKLDEMGISLHSVKGKGYRLPEKLELLSVDMLKSFGVSMKTKVLFQTVSTNADVRTLIQEGVTPPILVAAELQSGGRGRRGRVWHGGVGKNVMISIGWHFDQGASVVEGMSLAVGVAVARVLERLGVQGVALKWPNDVLINGKKVCGVLLEMVADQDTCDVVIGLGVNISMDNDNMSLIDQPWTDVKRELGHIIGRNKLIADLTLEIEKVCKEFESGDGLTSYLTEWMQHDALKNENVNVVAGNNSVTGVAKGINSAGAFLLECDGEVKVFHGGEVSVRRH